MINYESYWLNGMGLHSSQLKQIENIILNEKIQTIVEFGSGQSTKFLKNLKFFYNLNFSIVSFDHNKKYAYNDENVKIRSLQKCNDLSFDLIFKNKSIKNILFTDAENESNNFRAKNCFYKLLNDDLPNNIDLIILDGPNGNGRSLAYPQLLGKLKNPCYIMIDDVNHYDFLSRAKQIFDYEIITHVEDRNIHPLFSYALLRIKQ
jgi:hypothetical protein